MPLIFPSTTWTAARWSWTPNGTSTSATSSPISSSSTSALREKSPAVPSTMPATCRSRHWSTSSRPGPHPSDGLVLRERIPVGDPASTLRALGFEDVTDLIGGYGAWTGSGLPVSEPDGEGTTMSADAVAEVSAEEASELAEAGALLLDVREADEWDAGHAPEARWIPLSEVQARVDELPRDRRIVAICRSGGRSRALAGALLGAGYDVVNVEGGMRAWAAEDLAVVASDGLPGVVI